LPPLRLRPAQHKCFPNAFSRELQTLQAGIK